MTAKLVEEQL